MTIWLNGLLIHEAAARLDPADRGFTLGDGVFETLQVRNRAPLYLGRHLARLRRGADLLGIPVPFDDAALTQAVGALLTVNGLVDAVLRITLSHGVGPRGLLAPPQPQPTMLMTAAPLPPSPPPVRTIIASATRRNEYSVSAQIKSLSYLDNVLARREAAALGADDAILLNTQGRIAEASSANLFAEIGGVLVTPPLSDGVLPGIRRGLMLEQGLAVERSLSVEDLMRARHVFLTNSLGSRLVAEIDGQAFELGDLSRFES